jgi:hypothetical protein
VSMSRTDTEAASGVPPFDRPGRRALLSVSPAKLRRLRGLTESLARLSGCHPATLRTRSGFVAACALVAPDAAIGAAEVIAVREGRRTVGHAARCDMDVRRIAAAVVAHRTLPVVLHGPLVPAIARRGPAIPA